MSGKLKDFHHYKGSDLSRSEKVEHKVVETLLQSKLSDSKRESSIVWESKHSSGCLQIGRILAQKRGLDVEIAEVACVLHDIYVIVSGKYKDHAKLGAPIAAKILRQVGGYSQEETKTIINAVAHHSEKEIYTDDSYIELVKDADVFDCSLYKNSEGFYKIHKRPQIFKQYESRTRKVRKELGLPEKPIFRPSNE